MSDRAEFRTLLRQVEAADSPLDKIRAVALAWRTLRSLDAQERADLATTMGLDEAGTLVERMAMRKGGLAPSMVLEAVRAAQREDPSKLRGLVAGLRSSEGRKQAVVAGLRRMEARLAGEAEEEGVVFPEPEPEPEPETEAGAAAGVAAGTVAGAGAGAGTVAGAGAGAAADPDPEAVPDPDPDPDPVSDAMAEAESAPAPEAVEVLPPVPGPVRGDLAAAATRRSRRVTVGRSRSSPGEPPPASRPRRPQPRIVSPRHVPGPGSEPEQKLELEDWPEQSAPTEATLEAGASLTRRFRRLRELVDEGRPLGGEALASLIEGFSPGWARRRALTLLLRSGLVAGVAHAINLISGLESPTDRVWCAAALVDSTPLSDAAFEELLETLDHASARRRLRLRRGAEAHS